MSFDFDDFDVRSRFIDLDDKHDEMNQLLADLEDEPAPIDRHPFGAVALVLSVAGVILLGLFPEPVLDLLQISAASIF